MRFIAIVCLLLLGTSAFAAAYCPTTAEFQSKAQYFQLKAIRIMSDQSASLAEAEALQKEQDAFLNSLMPNCIQYFQTTKAPDCQRLGVVTAAYFMLDRAKQPAAKTQIYNIMQKLPQSCESAIYATKMMIK